MKMMFNLWLGYQNVALENLDLTILLASSCDHEYICNLAFEMIGVTSFLRKSLLLRVPRNSIFYCKMVETVKILVVI